MLTIKAPAVSVTDEGRRLRLSAGVVVDGPDKKSVELWLEVDRRYGEFLCFERSDAFVVALFHWAVSRGHDIRCEAPVTRELYYKINDEFSPMVALTNRGTRQIRLTAPLAGAIPKVKGPKKFAGASGSCGIDALWSLKMNLHESGCSDDSLDITHLVCMQLHVPNDDDTPETCRQTFDAICANAKSLCKEIERMYNRELEVIEVRSNFDNQCLPGLTATKFVSYGPAFAAYALQKLFSCYYLSSGYSIREFNLKDEFVHGESAAYELILCPFYSIGEMQLLSSGSSRTRIQKVEDICDWEPAFKHLSVCMRNVSGRRLNCTSLCTKCPRTILEIMAVGELEKFGAVFDVPYIMSHRAEYVAELMRGMLHGDIYAYEIWPHRKKMGFDAHDYIQGAWIVVKKICRKILRLGKMGKSYSMN